jgi:hypothetical protein
MIGLLVGLGMLGGGLFATGQQPPTEKRREFMRKKLEYSKGLIEGLTLENYDLIARNARALRTLSQAAEWEVPTIPNVEQYLPYTTEFQRLCDDLIKKARERNIDGATLAYVQLTMNCVNCHKYVRQVDR